MLVLKSDSREESALGKTHLHASLQQDRWPHKTPTSPKTMRSRSCWSGRRLSPPVQEYILLRHCLSWRAQVVEVAPAYGLDPTVRAALHRDAVALCEHVGYRNAGTVEFMVDKHGNYFFLEVNPRIQVGPVDAAQRTLPPGTPLAGCRGLRPLACSSRHKIPVVLEWRWEAAVDRAPSVGHDLSFLCNLLRLLQVLRIAH